ncbi:MAG: acylphosphatase [Hyphomicrobiaceae bacterium]
MSPPVSPAHLCVRLRIEGRVQGVGFRAFVIQEAAARGLHGWVRNRRDGGVEAVVAGPAADVEDLCQRARVGPRGARVDMLKVLEETGPTPQGFDVRPTV